MSKNGSIYVLGVGLSHNGSACLIRDGHIHVAIEKERLTRVKNDGHNDTAAVQYCLDAAGIRLGDVDVIVQNANFSMLQSGNDWFDGPRLYAADAPLVTISHHLAHAYSAVGTAPFDEGSVFVLDGSGSSYDDALDRTDATSSEIVAEPELRHVYFEKDSYYAFDHGELVTIYKDFSPWGFSLKRLALASNGTLHSVGGIYSGVSLYIFGGMFDAGKVMGLAPYGRPDVFRAPLFELRDGRVFVNFDVLRPFRRRARSRRDFVERFQEYADLAWWIQKETERAVLYVLNDRYERHPSGSLAYAGGVALNAVLNSRIAAETGFRRLYVQPAAQDNGLAIGCAYYGWMKILGRERPIHDGRMWFGRTYQTDEIAQTLARYDAQIEFTRDTQFVNSAAKTLADGGIVAWFQSNSEFGPRALGHRSILAHPGKKSTRDFINERIKLREEFRPFAPAVLQEDAASYFDGGEDSPYMLRIAPVRSEKRGLLEAVTHVDGSARIQTVTRELNGVFHDLLSAFKNLTGLPVLLNTSLNERGMPIVETPEQAVQFFLDRPFDLLVIEDIVVAKRGALRPQESVPMAESAT